MKAPGLPSRELTNNLRHKRCRKDTDQRRSQRRQLTGTLLLQPPPRRPVMPLLPSHRREQLLLLPMNLLPGTRRQRGLTVRQPGLMAQPFLTFPRSRVSPLLRP